MISYKHNLIHCNRNKSSPSEENSTLVTELCYSYLIFYMFWLIFVYKFSCRIIAYGIIINWIYQDLNHWVQGWVEWNLALDKTGGPTWASNFIDSPIIVNKTADEFYKQPMFYAIGHFSKFISRGSVRIKLTQSSVIKSVGFKRPDGAIAIVLYNRYDVHFK